MGYRSEVALCLTKNGSQILASKLAESDETLQKEVKNLLDFATFHIVDAHTKDEFWYWKLIKWYFDEREVRFIQDALKDIQKSEYYFARVGESYDDAEEHGYFYANPFQVELVRKISF